MKTGISLESSTLISAINEQAPEESHEWTRYF